MDGWTLMALKTLRLSASSGQTTVLVPVDKAVMAMPTKPYVLSSQQQIRIDLYLAIKIVQMQ
jgi:hypothetical protein